MKLITLIALFLGLNVFASFSKKENLYQFTGIVLDSISNESVQFATIIKKNGKGTICDKIGRFSIIIDKNDTVYISSVGYKSQQIFFPDSSVIPFIHMDIYLQPDTIEITEVIILPWATYEDLLIAILELDLPDDDLKKAKKNLELINMQISNGEFPDATISYKHAMNQHYERMSSLGTYPTNNLLNPFAWAKFFEAIKNGDFSKKE